MQRKLCTICYAIVQRNAPLCQRASEIFVNTGRCVCSRLLHNLKQEIEFYNALKLPRSANLWLHRKSMQTMHVYHYIYTAFDRNKKEALSLTTWNDAITFPPSTFFLRIASSSFADYFSSPSFYNAIAPHFPHHVLVPRCYHLSNQRQHAIDAAIEERLCLSLTVSLGPV